jgi:hypothetical protein
MDTKRTPTSTTGSVRTVLLHLAREQESLAATELAATPYWASCPSSVLGHRAAAEALRAEAEHLLVTR